jgi:pyruvate formate lyase activating enzyme
VPLIPGYNATPDSMRAIAACVRTLDGPITSIDLLPYHTLGTTKYAALGRDYPWAEQARLGETEVTQLAQVVVDQGLQVHIGG